MIFIKKFQSASDFFTKDPKRPWLKILFFLIIGGHLMYLSIRTLVPYPTGDGAEYVLMTEAFYNHFSPEIRLGDLESFKKTMTEFRPWDQVMKNHAFTPYESFLSYKDHEFKNTVSGLFTALNGKHYFYHFYTYSLINVPVRAIADINHFPPMRSFQVTNAIIVLITCFFLLFYSPFTARQSILICISFVFSSVYWYLGWTSPEVYTICLVALAFWFYFQGKRYIPIFLLSLAAMQNQPIALLAVFMSLAVLIEKGISIKLLGKLFFANILVLVPPLFYLYHFETTNLIKDLHYLSWDVVTANRIWGFFTDLNQGMILAIPLLLIVYPILWAKEFISAVREKKFRYDLLLPVFLLAMISIFCTMINWNHGMAVINRYATWSSAVLMIHAFFMMKGMELFKQNVLLVCCTAAQFISVVYNNKYYNRFDWDQELTKPWAIWTYENIPSLYNPDPVIFYVRTNRDYNFTPAGSPVVHLDKKGTLCKTLVHEDYINKLTDWGVRITQIDSIKASKKFKNGWAYIDKGEIESSYSAEQLLTIKKEARVKFIIDKIQRDEGWTNSVKKKAAEYNIPYEEMLRTDALYIYSEEQK